MKKNIFHFFILSVTFCWHSTIVVASIDGYVFSNGTLEKRYQTLNQLLRCPKCQNQTIADSNAPIAKDLRQQIYKMLESNYSNQQIIEFMVARYGEFVRYQPVLNKPTWLLWFGPIIFLFVAIFIISMLIKKSKRQTTVGFSADELKKLHDIENQL